MPLSNVWMENKKRRNGRRLQVGQRHCSLLVYELRSDHDTGHTVTRCSIVLSASFGGVHSYILYYKYRSSISVVPFSIKVDL